MDPCVATLDIEGEVYHCALRVEELEAKPKQTLLVNGRLLLLLLHRPGSFLTYSRKQIYALDPRCYHAGGPLVEGRVQDIEDYAVVRCPWHDYKIILTTGEGLFQDVAGNVKIKPNGQKQRLHKVAVRNGLVYVRVSTPETDGNSFECDRYAKLTK